MKKFYIIILPYNNQIKDWCEKMRNINVLNVCKICLAFTLAEVLITLGIIGVVASLTIPTLIKNSQKQEYVAKLQKTCSILSQAFKLYAIDKGCANDLKCTGLFSAYAQPNEVLWDEFVSKYLRVAKNCKTSVNQGCFPSGEYKLLNTATQVSENDYAFDSSSYGYKVILSDGTSLAFFSWGNSCQQFNTASDANPIKDICAYVIIDVNGVKSPNILGRDSFLLNLARYRGPVIGGYLQGLADFYGDPGRYLWSSTNVEFSCSATTPSEGYYCLDRIVDEGWQMNY